MTPDGKIFLSFLQGLLGRRGERGLGQGLGGGGEGGGGGVTFHSLKLVTWS